MAEKIYPLVCDVGIQKDGTKFNTKRWTDGLWMRFQRGLPQAIGGWRRIQPAVAYINGIYSSDYTIGQSSNNTLDSWNSFIKYQPRGITVVNTNMDNYILSVGCVSSYKWNNFKSAFANGVQKLDTWTVSLPVDNPSTPSDGPSRSGGVSANLLDKDGFCLTQINNFTPLTLNDGNLLISQNLTAIGPYVPYYNLENTQWVFATSYSEFIPQINIEKIDENNKSIYFFDSVASQGSNCLFSISLYNLKSISTTYVYDDFKESTFKNSTSIQIFPVVYVTSIDGRNLTITGFNYSNICLSPMYQLSHSGNPTGAGQGKTIYNSNYTDYGSPFSSSNILRTTGTGHYYFPNAQKNGTNEVMNYIWSSDCVFCSGGVLNLGPYTFFYNYHPWDWTLNQPSAINGYIAYTHENMAVYTTDTKPVPIGGTGNDDVKVPTMVNGGNGIIPNEKASTIIQEFTQVASTNIVYGAQVRGGSNSPSALFWSLDSLIKCSYTGGTTKFSFDTVASNLSILSSKCVVEVNNIFYWIGIDQFYYYNGTVQTLYNDTNINYFFANVDTDNVQKIWGCKVGQYNEIWWHYPNKKLSNYSGECNAVIIYNYTQGQECWYDSEFPVTGNLNKAGRVCGTSISIFQYPIWIDAYSQADLTAYSTSTENYWFAWIHENSPDLSCAGYLAQLPITTQFTRKFAMSDIRFSIPTYLVSRLISLPAIGPDNNWNGIDRWIRLLKAEPDLVQECDVEMILYGKKYINDYENILDTYLIPANDLQSVSVDNNIMFNATSTPVSLNINGKYASTGIAIFPNPRLITATNYSYFEIDDSAILFNIKVFLTGTYKNYSQTETLTLSPNNKQGNYSTITSTYLYDTITSINVVFDTTVTSVISCSGQIDIGTVIPYGIEKGNIESQRLQNFYIDINKQARIFRIKLAQNLLGSDFQLGQFLLHFDVGDGRQ